MACIGFIGDGDCRSKDQTTTCPDCQGAYCPSHFNNHECLVGIDFDGDGGADDEDAPEGDDVLFYEDVDDEDEDDEEGGDGY